MQEKLAENNKKKKKSGGNSSPGSRAAVVLWDHCLTRTEICKAQFGGRMRNHTSQICQGGVIL